MSPKHHIAASILYMVSEDLNEMPNIPLTEKLKEAMAKIDEAKILIQDLIEGRR